MRGVISAVFFVAQSLNNHRVLLLFFSVDSLSLN
jgi:hypothetical protein